MSLGQGQGHMRKNDSFYLFQLVNPLYVAKGH